MSLHAQHPLSAFLHPFPCREGTGVYCEVRLLGKFLWFSHSFVCQSLSRERERERERITVGFVDGQNVKSTLFQILVCAWRIFFEELRLGVLCADSVTVRCEKRGTLQSSSPFQEPPHIILLPKKTVLSGQVALVTEGRREEGRVKRGGELSVKRLRCARDRVVEIPIERDDEGDQQQCTCRQALRRCVKSSHRFKTPSQTHSAH